MNPSWWLRLVAAICFAVAAGLAVAGSRPVYAVLAGVIAGGLVLSCVRPGARPR